jgi:hypothetical protein
VSARVKQMPGDLRRLVRRLLIGGAVAVVLVAGVVGYGYFNGSTTLGMGRLRAALTGKRAGARKYGVVKPKTARLAPSRPAAATPASVMPSPTPSPAAHPVASTAATVQLAGAASAAPQISVPNINGPKRAAQRAVDATNANIAEQTGQALPSRGGAAPAVVAPPRSGPGSVPAVPPPAGTRAPAAAALPPVTREVFTYEAGGRRDPFYSLILTEDLRPLLSDLKLVGILYEASGRRSVAIMRDLGTNAQYRVAQGQTLGRMRVAAIRPKGVIFTIDEFGLSRQDSLMLSDSLKVRIR